MTAQEAFLLEWVDFCSEGQVVGRPGGPVTQKSSQVLYSQDTLECVTLWEKVTLSLPFSPQACLLPFNSLLTSWGKSPCCPSTWLSPTRHPPGVLLWKLPLSLHVEHEVPPVDVLYYQEQPE
jgi:hypothetical protein